MFAVKRVIFYRVGGLRSSCPKCLGFTRIANKVKKPLKIKAYFTDNGFWVLNPSKPIYMHKEQFFENEQECWGYINVNYINQSRL